MHNEPESRAMEPKGAPRGREDGQGFPTEVDTVVIGGGVAGASTLYHLAQDGVEALLVERGTVAGGATSAAIGILSPPVRQPFHEMARHRGIDVATRVWRFALDSVAGLAQALRAVSAEDEAELDLSGGTVLAEPHTEHEVREAFEALRGAGFAVRWLEGAHVREGLGGRGFVGGYLIEGLGSIHPGTTARALVRTATMGTATVREGVSVTEVSRDGDGLVCATSAGVVRARSVVHATHVDGGRFAALLNDAVVPVRGQALSARLVGGGSFSGAFSTDRKLNLWRTTRTGRLLLSGWRNDAWDRAYRRTRADVDPHLQDDLEAWFSQAFPGLRLTDVHRWGGIFGWTADFLPLVGGLPGRPGEVAIAGFSGGGLPFAFACGRLAADAALGRAHPADLDFLAPERFA